MSGTIAKNFQSIYISSITPYSTTGSTNLIVNNITTTNLITNSATIPNVALTGSLNASQIISTNISTSTLNAPSGLTTGNINFTGNLYQNGVPYLGSQWTTTSGNLSYTSGNVIVGGLISSTNLIITNATQTNVIITNGTVTNMNSSTNTIGTLNATGITTTSLLSTNSTSTNSIITNGTITNMNSSTNTIGTLNATGITTTSLLSTSASIGNISAGSINLSSNLNIAGTLTVVNLTTTNLTMSNGNALFNVVTSGTIINTGLISTTNLATSNISSGTTRISTSLIGIGNSNTLGSIITTGGNIGIGTTSPAYTLDVSGTGRFITGVSAGQYLYASNSSGALIIGSDSSAFGALSSTQAYIIGNRTATQNCAGIGFQRSGTRVSSMGLDTNNNMTFSLQNTLDNYYFKSNMSDYNNTTGGNFLMSILGNGNVGINATSPSAKLHVVTSDATAAGSPTAWDSTYAVFGQSSNAGGAVGIGYHSTSGGCLLSLSPNITWQPMTYRGLNHQFVIAGTIGTPPSMIINGSGNIGIKTTAPSDYLQVASVMLMASTGNLTCTGDVYAFGTISDQRLKTNVISIDSENALNTVKQLRPVTFDWKNDIFNVSRQGQSDSGFIAQEIETLIPHAVGEYTQIETGDVYKNMRHERIIPYLTAAIQRLISRIEENEREIDYLKSKIVN